MRLDTKEIATPVHRFASANDIHFRFVHITEKSFDVPDVEHRHGYWSVFIFLEGEGRHVIDFKEVAITPGSIHIVLPGQIHALHGGKGFVAYALIFTEDFFLVRSDITSLLMRLFRFMDAGEAAAFDISDSEMQFFSSLLQLMKHEFDGDDSTKGKVLLDLLSAFLGKCSGALQLPQLPSGTTDSLEYIQMRNAVEKNFRRMHSVAEFAALLNISTKQLNKLCRQHTGVSVLEFIHARIVVEAKRMLKFSDKSIKQIAYDLHFTDPAHFANFFKQKTSHTPLEFRGQ
jgi:AraC family transcriptional regulator, transcriptional activator of pobA